MKPELFPLAPRTTERLLDQRHFHAALGERLGARQARDAAADNHDLAADRAPERLALRCLLRKPVDRAVHAQRARPLRFSNATRRRFLDFSPPFKAPSSWLAQLLQFSRDAQLNNLRSTGFAFVLVHSRDTGSPNG
jgi:hypothetical protein